MKINEQSHTITKRETTTTDPIMSKIHDFQRLLNDLESEIKETSKGNKIKCFIESSYDKTNCTKGEMQETNPQEENSRKKSKEQIDLLIRILKKKIGDLKSIKKHLRINRLNNADTGYDTDDEETEDTKINDLVENKENNFTNIEENIFLSNVTSEADLNNSSVGGGSLETSTVVITNEIKGRFFIFYGLIFFFTFFFIQKHLKHIGNLIVKGPRNAFVKRTLMGEFNTNTFYLY